MAIPNPSITVTEIDETDKRIYYKIEYGENKRFTANKSNYYDYLAKQGEPEEPYVGYFYASGNKTSGDESYQEAYDNYKTSITISVEYQYFKEYIKETYSGWVNYGSGSYVTQSEAENEMHELQYGDQGFYRVIQGTDGKYYIQGKKDAQYSHKQDSFPTTGTVTATVSFTKKPESEEPESPAVDYEIENITDTSAEINFINLKAEDSIKITLYNASAPIETKEATVQEGSSTMSFIFENLEPNTYYTVSIQVNGKPLTSGGFTTDGQSESGISYTLTNITTNSVTVNISGALPAKNVAVSFYGVDTVNGTTNPNGTASIVVSNLTVGKKYSGSIRVDGTVINNKDIVFYTLFDWWLSQPVEGNTMGVYNNSPAPVKAEEWNRLVDLINSKLSKSISKVASGDTMDASSGGNVKVVASALGVSVESKEKVTASFFNALKNAINNK